MTLFFFLSFAIGFKKTQSVKSPLYHVLMISFMLWITLATYNAQFQDFAWIKYDYVIKTLFFAYFIPFTLTSRDKIEAFVLTCLASYGTFIFTAGVKTLFGGGGYNISLVGGSSFIYSEGSMLSTLAVSMLPLFAFAMSKSLMVERMFHFKWIMFGLSLCSVLTVIGTQARTGLVVIAFYASIILFKTKHKFKMGIFIALIPLLIFAVAPASWFERMSSLESGEVTTSEASAVGRLVVWRWTLDYVSERPLMGGGFYSYLANGGVLHRYAEEGETEIRQPDGKAFHNIFFEVLGETGYVGLLFFCGIIGHMWLLNSKSSKKQFSNPATVEWAISLKNGINVSLAIYCIGGLFVGIAFYPWMYYLYGVSIAIDSLNEE